MLRSISKHAVRGIRVVSHEEDKQCYRGRIYRKGKF